MKNTFPLRSAFWLLVILYCLFAPGASAAVTNITCKITTEVAGGPTNNVSIKFTGDGTAKDALTVDSLVWQWTQYKTTGVYTNDFDNWLKDTCKVALQATIPAKSASDLGVAVAKVAAAATTDASLLSTAQKNQLLAIAASLP